MTSNRFYERRYGPFGWRVGWRVYERCDDGIDRWTYTNTFRRWLTAARVAQALNLAYYRGQRAG